MRRAAPVLISNAVVMVVAVAGLVPAGNSRLQRLALRLHHAHYRRCQLIAWKLMRALSFLQRGLLHNPAVNRP